MSYRDYQNDPMRATTVFLSIFSFPSIYLFLISIKIKIYLYNYIIVLGGRGGGDEDPKTGKQTVKVISEEVKFEN